MVSRAAYAWFSRGSHTSLAVAPFPRRAWNSLSDSMGLLAWLSSSSPWMIRIGAVILSARKSGGIFR